ncbi:hypothetical protein ACFS3C_05950 [Azotobacter vinelandii]
MPRSSRLFAIVLRILLGLGFLGLMLLALSVSLGRQLAPLVADTRLEVQARVRDVLDMPVAIRALEGRWTALSPRLLARDVTIGEGEDALHLERVQVRLDLLRTLLARELRVAALEVEGVSFTLAQDAGGRWTLEGAPQRGRQRPFNPDESLRALERIDHLSLLDSQVTFAPHGQEPFSLQNVDLTLRSDGWRQRLDGRLILPDGQPLQLSLHGQLADEGWRQSSAELYVSLPQSDWASWVPRSLTGDWRIERLRAGGEFWLAWDKSRLQRAAARLQAPELRIQRTGQAPAEVRDLALSGHFSERWRKSPRLDRFAASRLRREPLGGRADRARAPDRGRCRLCLDADRQPPRPDPADPAGTVPCAAAGGRRRRPGGLAAAWQPAQPAAGLPSPGRGRPASRLCGQSSGRGLRCLAGCAGGEQCQRQCQRRSGRRRAALQRRGPRPASRAPVPPVPGTTGMRPVSCSGGSTSRA